jgi:hypothetical protein
MEEECCDQLIFTQLLSLYENIYIFQEENFKKYCHKSYVIIKELIKRQKYLLIPANNNGIQSIIKIILYSLKKEPYMYYYFRETNPQEMFWCQFYTKYLKKETNESWLVNDNSLMDFFINDEIFNKVILNKIQEQSIVIEIIKNERYKKLIKYIEEQHAIEEICLLTKDGPFILACMMHPNNIKKYSLFYAMLCILNQIDLYYKYIYELERMKLKDTVTTLILDRYQNKEKSIYREIIKRMVRGEEYTMEVEEELEYIPKFKQIEKTGKKIKIHKPYILFKEVFNLE